MKKNIFIATLLTLMFSVHTIAQNSVSIPPKPTQEGLTEGLVYRVLLYPDNRSSEKAGGPGDYVSSYGETPSRSEADSIKAEALSKGFSEAIVVPYHNNQQISLQEALALEPAGTTPEESPAADPSAAGVVRADRNEGLTYKVQILSSPTPLAENDAAFRKLKNIEAYEHNGMMTYTWGKTKLRFEAARLQREMWSQGFHDAFVVFYYNNKRITAGEAARISERSGAGSAGGPVYKVQLWAGIPKMPLHDSFFNDLQDIEEYRHDGMYKYTWGKSSSLREAERLKDRLRTQGFPDAFIVAFLNHKRVSLEEANGI